MNPSQGDYSLTKVAMPTWPDAGGLEDRAAALWQLRECLEPKLQEQGMENLYREIELPLCATLYRMEREGVAVDRNTLVSFGQMLTERIAACEQANLRLRRWGV